MASTRELIQSAIRQDLVDEDGKAVTLRLLPGLTRSEVDEFAASLPAPPSDDVRDLLEFCSGIDGALETIDFTGRSLDDGFGLEELIPHPLAIAHDGFGNYWTVDLIPGAPAWGPIYFCCHDAPVMLMQSATIHDFVTEVLRTLTPPHKSLIDDVHEDRLFEVSRKNPGVISQEAALNSEVVELRSFAESLDPAFEVVDLRNAPVGMGFSWGRYGPRTEVIRFGKLPIFAYRKPEKKGLLAKILGG